MTTLQFNKHAFVLVLLVAVYPATGYSQGAGQIEFAVGNVAAIAAGGQPRSLKKRAEINSGDTVVTGDDGRAQVRFSDGGYVSLQPNTRFRIDEYRYQGSGDGSEKGFFSLVKGGLRAVTGVIGKNNKSNYQVNTPVATIGIRGTHYTLRLCENDCVAGGSRIINGLYASVGEGQIFMANALGRLNLEQGQKGFVADQHTPPRPTDRPPLLSAPQRIKESVFIAAKQESFIAGDQRDASGLPVNLQHGTKTLPLKGAVASDVGALPALVNGTIDGLGRLLAYNDGSVGVISQGTTRPVDTGTDGALISWGRWVNGQTTGSVLSFSGNESLHYVITGKPTPATVFAAGGGPVLTYSLMGKTPATSNTGGIGLGVTGGTLKLDLTTTTALLSVNNLTVGFGGNAYVMNGSTVVTSASFTVSPTTVSPGCVGTCSTAINGVFAGANAERAGLTYKIADTSPLVISGAAAFTR